VNALITRYASNMATTITRIRPHPDELEQLIAVALGQFLEEALPDQYRLNLQTFGMGIAIGIALTLTTLFAYFSL
jgi:hypothetical protein